MSTKGFDKGEYTVNPVVLPCLGTRPCNLGVRSCLVCRGWAAGRSSFMEGAKVANLGYKNPKP